MIGYKKILLNLVLLLITNPLVPGVFGIEKLKIEPVNKAKSGVSIYRIEFTTTNPLTNNAVIHLTFSPGFNLSNAIIASSNSINGGFKVQQATNKVTISRTGLGDPVAAGKNVDILVANVINPDQAGTDYLVAIEIEYGGGQPVRSASSSVVIENQDVD